MAKLITKFKYIKPGNGAGSYLKYIATREGVEKIDDSKKLLPTTAKQKILIAKLLRKGHCGDKLSRLAHSTVIALEAIYNAAARNFQTVSEV